MQIYGNKSIFEDNFQKNKLAWFCIPKSDYLCTAFRKKWPRSLMDRASDYGSEGWGFESLRGHRKKVNYLYINS